MPDPQTLAVYGASVERYRRTIRDDRARPHRDAFVASLPDAASVLDFGCGPGLDAARMAEAGLTVEAWDASAEMAAAAAARPGVTARCAPFAALDAEAAYHGIWAAFSLLHAPRTDLPGLIAAMHRALKPGGRLYLAMKLGEGEHRDRIGRLYTYVGEDELAGWLTDAGFTVTEAVHGRARGMAGTEDPFICLFADA